MGALINGNPGQVSPWRSGSFYLGKAWQETMHLTRVWKILLSGLGMLGEAWEGGEERSLFLNSFSSSDNLTWNSPSSSDLRVLLFPPSWVIFLGELTNSWGINYHPEGWHNGPQLKLWPFSGAWLLTFLLVIILRSPAVTIKLLVSKPKPPPFPIPVPIRNLTP